MAISKNKAIFLDRDGTINVNTHYVNNPDDITILPNVYEGLKIFQKMGYLLIIVTNQSGIARGYFTEDDLKKVNDRVLYYLNKEGIYITDIFFCPYHIDGIIKKYKKNSPCRKPKPGMIKEAAKKYNIDVKKSYMIGDMEADIKTGFNAKCKASILIKNTAVSQKFSISPTYTANDMLDAALWVLMNENNNKLISYEYIDKLVNKLKKEKKKIVFTNGVFDLIHPGHINFLKASKMLVDVLIVGLNSDSSVKKNKGVNRPVNDLKTRIEMLKSFDFVDYIVVFSQKTPVKLIEKVKPDFHIKDIMYANKKIPEYDIVVKNNGKVVYLPRIGSFSSTNIIEKIKKMN